MCRYRRFIALFPLIMVLACNLITGPQNIGEGQVSQPTEIPLMTTSTTGPTNLTPTYSLSVTAQSSEMPPATGVPPDLSTFCPQNNEKLLFASEINPGGIGPVNFEVFMAGSDGSEISRLTNDDRWNGNPAWSPDRCRVAFATAVDQQSNEDIYMMNSDGSGLVRLTNDVSFEREPSWSPDGAQIVFIRELDNNREIFVMKVDGSAVRQLTDHPAQDEDPEWSPIQDEIVFSSRRDGNWEIYRMSSDGTDLVRLTNDKSQDVHPTWSPDGERIAFLSNRSDYVEVYIIDRDGSNLRQVTFQNGDVPTVDIELNWSQNGDWLAFTCTVPGKDGGGMQAICAVGEDGGNVRVLVNRDPSRSHEPDW